MLFCPSSPLAYGLTPYDTNIPDLAAQFIAGAKRSIRTIAYNFSLQAVLDAYKAAEVRGVHVAGLLDHTQECGPSEKAKVEALIASMLKGDWYVGTSPVAGAIMHRKMILRDAPESEAEATAITVPAFASLDDMLAWDGPLLWSGSYNFSVSATKQLNDVSIIASPQLALLNCQKFEEQKAWVIANEVRYQPTVASLTAEQAA